MAKKKVLSLDEKLEDALIPKEEQPYELPENWKWVYFGSIIEIQGGSQPPKNQWSKIKTDTNVRMLQIRDFTKSRIVDAEYVEKSNKLKLCSKDDILIARYGASIGKILTGETGAYNVALVKTIFDKNNLSTNFLYNFLNSYNFQNQILANGRSRTAQAGFNKEDLNFYSFPLPPLAEQERIVAKMESMLDKVKQAKELISEARETFKLRRASILHQAFTGELTKEWREENPIESGRLSVDSLLEKINVEKVAKWEEECKKALTEARKKPRKPMIKPVEEMKVPSEEQPYELPNGWGWVRLGDISDSIVPNRDKPKSFTGEIPWLTMSDLDTYKNINYSNRSSLFLSTEEIEKYRCRIIPKGSVIMSCIGNFGISIVNDQDVSSNQQLHAFLLGNNVSSKYISYLIKNSKIYYEELSTSTTIKYINKSKCESLPTPLPPLEEQKEIVKKIEIMLEAEEKTKELLDMENQIELLEKSILSKAFRGELGTKDPNDEPAMELLRRVLGEGK